MSSYLLVGLVLGSIIINSASPNDGADTVGDETLYPTNSLITPGALFPLGGTLPTSRVLHSVIDVHDYVIVYGGYGVDGSFLEDINIFYTVNQRWSGPVFRTECCNYDNEQFEAMGFEEGDVLDLPSIRTGFQGDLPLARAEHAAAAIDTKMYMFGGLTQDFGYVQDLYSFDVNALQWTQLLTETNEVPCRRAGHSMVSDGSTFVYVFGGRSSLISNDRNFGLNDIWRYNVVENKWTNLYPTISGVLQGNGQGSIPPARQYASLAYIDHKLYLFGGVDPVTNSTYNDVWMFHPAIKTWTRLFAQQSSLTAGFVPPPLYHAHILPVPLESYYNSNNSEVTGFIVYGGVGGGGSCGGSACGQQHTVLGQSFVFLFTHNEWAADVTVTGGGNTQTAFDRENNYVNSSLWAFGRLSAYATPSRQVGAVTEGTSGGRVALGRGSDEGRYVKNYALERVVYVPSRKLFYEFGGLQYSGAAGGLSAGEMVLQQLDTAGGVLTNPLWDLVTGEQLRDAVSLPTNPTWAYGDAFIPAGDSRVKNVEFLRSFRVFSTTLKDIVLMKESFIN